MHYFSNKSLKFAKPGSGKPPMLVTWSCVVWPNYSFSNWLWQSRTL